MKPVLKAPGTKRLKLTHDKLVSSYAFDCNLCRYIVDCHVHAPQYAFTGTHTDTELMEWLDTYTFPAGAFTRPLSSSTYALFVGYLRPLFGKT